MKDGACKEGCDGGAGAERQFDHSETGGEGRHRVGLDVRVPDND